MITKKCTQLMMRSLYLLLFISAGIVQQASAQTVLAGLTSNGGADGKGTAFNINTNGSGFSVMQAFAD